MPKHFSPAEWQTINTHLDQNPTAYGMPERRDDSVILASWNIRKFGTLADEDGPRKSPGAFAMIERFCSACDLVAIQEVQPNTASLYELRDRLNAAGGTFDVIYSDITGRAPGQMGMAERSGFLFNTARVRRGDLASDLSFDRSAVVKNMNKALAESIAKELPPSDDPTFMEKVQHWLSGATQMAGARLKKFVQFIRAPHLVEFVIEGPGGDYQLYCVNAHLVSGDSKRERQQEFFALLEWLLLDSESTVAEDGKIFLLMADLNLDFESSVDKRKRGVEAYLTDLNSERNLRAKVNFPFLDGGFLTNARRDETYDHIAWIAQDERLPRGRHNALAGTLGANQFDYGMFDFTQLFVDAGPAQGQGTDPDYSKFEHDFSDHMPIWVRLPIPSNGQHRFTVD
ncbi:hypothetical protein [Actibacterium lipolyticum]|uniref:Endonuclease/exonuclease/phosphatase n=1 Tax=Actibacterium lipolyticum TaxID=1524263 RepID=A0A238JS02_9RHOB|nr:hypothetical protein [Actibacterium lipolyticum]SMX33365.1 hypothetical protein COL8621_01009 [Actibacterium lipolyticum]